MDRNWSSGQLNKICFTLMARLLRQIIAERDDSYKLYTTQKQTFRNPPDTTVPSPIYSPPKGTTLTPRALALVNSRGM